MANLSISPIACWCSDPQCRVNGCHAQKQIQRLREEAAAADRGEGISLRGLPREVRRNLLAG